MHFQLSTVPTTDPTTVADELRRFITNTGRFGLSTVVVQPPYAQRALHLWVIEVPDPVADWVEDRLFPIVLGPAYPVKRTGPVAPRPEWTGHALVLPTAAAQALDPLLLRPWTSAALHVRWTPGRCGALLHYSADDTPRLDEIRALGWQIVPLASLLTRAMRQPFITRRSSVLPLLTSAVAPMPVVTSAPTARSTPAQDHAAAQALGTAPDPAGLPSALAGPGEPGFLLGVTPEDVGVKLAWRALACAVEGPGPRQRAAFLALLRRAFAHGMGVVAIVPRGLTSDGALQPWA